jgi:hypothetical protein
VLELIQSRLNSEPMENPADAIGEDPSHLFINSLIEQIKYVHMEEVWNANLRNLTDGVNLNKNKYLKLVL